MDVLSKIIALILVGILIFILPLQYLFEHQLLLFDDYMEDETIHLVEEMREKGFLDEDMYERYLEKLNITGIPYDIDIEHAKPKSGSDMTMIEELPGSLVVSTDLDRLPQISSFATHTHTIDCYVGHRHVASCYSVSNITKEGKIAELTMRAPNINYNSVQEGNYNYDYRVYFQCASVGHIVATLFQLRCNRDSRYDKIELVWYDAWGYLYSFTSRKHIVRGSSAPGYEYSSDMDNYVSIAPDPNYPYYVSLVREITRGATHARQLEILGIFGVNTHMMCFSCARAQGAPFYSFVTGQQFPICSLAQDETPICNQVVTSITPTNPVQTVDKGGSLVTTATGTYLDGHTGVVSCTSNYNPNQVGVQTVTLTYSGLVGNAKTTGTRTCTINVTVKETNIPATLTVTPSTYSVYNGTEPTYTVVVTYTNGSTKTITSGYTKTGWSSGYGLKTVTFGYTENGKNVTNSINITVKPNIESIEVIPSEQTIERYKDPSFTVKAWYEDGSYSYASSFTTSGFNKNNIGVQNVTIQYKENAISRNGSAKVIVTPMKVVCPICDNTYFLDGNDFDQGCPVCKVTITEIQASPSYITVSRNEPLGISVTATFADGHTEGVTGWTSNYDSSQSGSQLVTVIFAGKYAFVNVTVVDEKSCSICDFTYALTEDGTDPGCPVCKELLISISASPDNQTVEQGEDMSLTVTGQYKDGHKEELFGWSSSYNKDLAGEQEITVYCQNLTCSVRVTVISEEEVQCSTCGAYYNYRDYPWGCPLCAGTVTRIDAKLLSGGTRTPYGVALDLSIILYYRDGHREMADSGWQDNFDPFVLGEQLVTISYTDIFNNVTSCTLTVNVSNTLTQTVCENGHVYYAEVGECPYCAANNGKVVSLYSDCHFTEEIINELYENGIYYFSEGDYITIKVTVRTEGTMYSMGNFRKNEGVSPITYGGEVA